MQNVFIYSCCASFWSWHWQVQRTLITFQRSNVYRKTCREISCPWHRWFVIIARSSILATLWTRNYELVVQLFVIHFYNLSNQSGYRLYCTFQPGKDEKKLINYICNTLCLLYLFIFVFFLYQWLKKMSQLWMMSLITHHWWKSVWIWRQFKHQHQWLLLHTWVGYRWTDPWVKALHLFLHSLPLLKHFAAEWWYAKTIAFILISLIIYFIFNIYTVHSSNKKGSWNPIALVASSLSL